MNYMNETVSPMTNQMINESIISSQEYLTKFHGLTTIGSDAEVKRTFANAEGRAALFEAYTEGINDPTEKAQLLQLLENTAEDTLLEMSSMGIDGLSSMNMPVIKKLWYATKVRQAFKTVVATSPEMAIAFEKPYLWRLDKETGNRIERALPYSSIYDNDGTGIDLNLINKTSENTSFNDAVTITYYEGTKVTPIDRDFKITTITFTLTAAEGETANTITCPVLIPRENSNALYVDVIATQDLTIDPIIAEDGETVTNKAAIDAAGVVFARGTNLGSLSANIKLESGTATFRFAGQASDKNLASWTVGTEAHLSAEGNENNWSVGLRIKKQTISIGTGVHIDAPITIETMRDLKALYKIDAMTRLTDMMTNALSQGLEEELIDFGLKCFYNRPTNGEYSENTHYNRAEAHTYYFDAATMTGYSDGPKQWREQIRPVFDDAAVDIEEECKFTEGKYVILAHPKTALTLKNPDWQHKGGAGSNVAGSSINYDSAVYHSDSRVFHLISSFNYPKGYFGLSFIPSGDSQVSQLYLPYAYTMSTNNSYRSPNAVLTPSLIMTKRHTKFEYTPTTALIVVRNMEDRFHTGDLYDTKFSQLLASLGKEDETYESAGE